MVVTFRDDDLNYFYDFEDYVSITEDLIGTSALVIGVVPKISGSLTGCVPSYRWRDSRNFPFLKSAHDTDIMKDFLARNKNFSIALHGYDHTYKKDVLGRALPEFARPFHNWKRLENSKREIEAALDVVINEFIPPGNRINRRNMSGLQRIFNRVHYSVPLRRPKDWTLQMLPYLCLRGYDILKYRNPTYRSRLHDYYDYGSYALVPKTTLEEIDRIISLHKKLGKPLSFAYHFWELEAITPDGITLSDLIRYIRKVTEKEEC